MSDQHEIEKLKKRIKLLEDAMLSMTALAVQNQMFLAEIRLEIHTTALAERTKPFVDEMSRRTTMILDKLSESIDAGK